MIKLLQSIKKNGGDIDTFGISTGVREAHFDDANFNIRDYEMGWAQWMPDGSFSIVATGHKNEHEPNTKPKKRPGKKKGKKRSN